MKKILLIILLIATPLAANARTIHVEFSYAGTCNGFRLYQNGVQVCETLDGTVRQIDCDVTITALDEYYLTAITTSGESSPSPKRWTGRIWSIYRRMQGGAFAGGSM